MGGCFLFVPPVDNFLGWSNDTDTNDDGVPDKPQLFAGVDYAGIADDHFGGIFGTELSGTVTEKPLDDGRAEVKVILHTKNANAWVIELDLAGDILGQIANGPTLFGHRPQDVDAGAEPALADTFLQVVFINTAPGDPLPDLILFIVGEQDPDQELISTRFVSRAAGSFTAASEFGDGTPGRCTINQNGVGDVGQPGHPTGRGVGDTFPAEFIELKVVDEEDD